MPALTKTIPKGYKQTEIGVIPTDWDVMPLKNIARYRRGSFPQPYGLSKWYDNARGAPFVQVFDVDENMKLKSETKQKISKDAQEMSVFVKKGSVLLTIQGSIGRIAVTQYDTYVDRTLLLFESFILPTDKYYFAYAVLALFEIEKGLADGGTIKTITKEKLSDFLLAFPSKPEQESIAIALCDIDTLIEKKESLIEKKKAVKQGAMQELLTGKRRLPGFSGEWREKTLGDVADFYKGKGLPKSDIVIGGKYKCIHYGELFTVYHEEIKNVLSSTNNKEDLFFSKANDVLMPTSDVTPNGLATASCVKEDGVVLGGDVMVIRTHKGLCDGTFISYGIRQNRKQVMQLVSGSTVYHLYGSDMKKYKFYSPPTKQEQTAIATILSDMDTEIENLESELTKWRDMKQGMMQTLLTGKKRLIK